MRLICLFLFVMSVSLIAGELKFETSSREVVVQHWKVTGLTENTESDHYWLCLSQQIGPKLKDLNNLRVRFVGTPDYSNSGLWVYHVVISDFVVTTDMLKSDPTFISMISRTDYDKLSYDIVMGSSGSTEIMAKVDFDSLVGVEEATSILGQYNDSVITIFTAKNVAAIVMANASAFRSMARRWEIVRISEFSMRSPTMDNSRLLMGVDSLQYGAGFDTTTFPPTMSWNVNRDFTGDSVVVAIYDGGTSPDDLNFREMGSTGATVLRNAPSINSWVSPIMPGSFHGTHVMGIVAGNGWPATPGLPYNQPYQWRGVAPKARLISGGGYYNYGGAEGDVNNHSTLLDSYVRSGINKNACWYTWYSLDVDDEMSSHDTTNPMTNNVVVWATGNFGLSGGATNDSTGCGLYSIACNTKNAIKVGGAQKYTRQQAPFSSMGPTRDGRVGPDLIATGGSSVCMEKYLIEIDSICWKSEPGVVKRSWDFVAKKNDNLPDSLWWRNTGGMDSMWIEDGSLLIAGPSLNTNACFLSSDTILSIHNDPTGAPNTDGNDSLIITYRITDSLSRPGFPIGQRRLITAGLSCDLDAAPDFGCELLLEVNGGWCTLRTRFSEVLNGTFIPLGNPGWPSNGVITKMTMLFAPLAIMSSNMLHEGMYDYAPEQGTSMAAPQVTGVAALMAQKFGKTMLGGMSRLRDHASWNSTFKAILCHTATDIVDTSMMLVNGGQKPEYWALWRNVANVNGVGPDWGTGYGFVNASKAIEYVSPNHFREDTVGNRLMRYYDMVVPPGTPTLKVTIAWDDPAAPVASLATAFDPKLVNDLNLYLLPPSRSGVSRPWCLSDHYMRKDNMVIPFDGVDSSWIDGVWTRGVSPDTIKAHPAYPGNDSLNNIEMVDVNNPVPGTWTVVVEGRLIRTNQSMNGTSFNPKQDFSLAYDIVLSPNTTISDNGKDLVGLTITEAGRRSCARMTVVGNVQLSGSEQYGMPPAGLRFVKGPVVGLPTPNVVGFVPTTGNMIRESMTPNSAAWLANPANLQGGLVFRNPAGQIVSHIGSTGSVHMRCSDFQLIRDM